MNQRFVLRYVDVDATEEHFGGDPNPVSQIAASVDLEHDELIVGIESRSKQVHMGYGVTVARVWIAKVTSA